MKKLKSLDIVNVEQGTYEWRKARLGYITASMVGDIMGNGKTAMGKIAAIAGERDLADDIKDDEETFNAFSNLQCPTKPAMRHGHECEPIARDLYSMLYDVEVTECGQIRDKKTPWFAYSPDGLIVNKAGNVEGIIEIKSPATLGNCMRYRLINNAIDLKLENSTYYYQVMAGLAITDAKWCDFIVYSAFTAHNKLHVVRIERDDKAIKEVVNRVKEVNEYILKTYGQR